LSMHPAVDENNYSGYALYDNIVITNNGEVKLVIFKDEGDLNPEKFRLSHQKDSTSKVELLVFTAEEEQAFIDAEEARIQAEIEREAAKIAAQEEKEAAAKLAAEQAAAEAEAARLAAEAEEAEESAAEPTPANAAETAEGSVNIGLIIGIAVAVIAIIVIVIIVAKKKKSA